MAESTGIAWTDHTYNPWQGCQKVSPGCDHCYMYRDKRRYGQDPEKVVRSAPATFRKPLKWNADAKKVGAIRRVFVASWADFFAREADPWRAEAWEIIRACDSLIFQILTKRHARIADCLPADWGDGWPNVWLGVTGENQEWADRRWAALAKVSAVARFVSYEPAIGPLSIAAWATVPDWLIIGGESGPHARPFDLAWARSVRDQCASAGVALFFKQAGARPYAIVPPSGAPDDGGDVAPLHYRDPAGADPSEWPADLRVRQFPEVRS